MKALRALFFGLFVFGVVGILASCGEQPLQPSSQQGLEMTASISDTTVVLTSIPIPPPDSTGKP